VLDAMLPYLRDQYGNPSSDHPIGRRAAAAVEQARARVAALIGAEPGEMVFSSGGTESNNLAIRGTASVAEPNRNQAVPFCRRPPKPTRRRRANSPTELSQANLLRNDEDRVCAKSTQPPRRAHYPILLRTPRLGSDASGHRPLR
jgi:hypothetical protein